MAPEVRPLGSFSCRLCQRICEHQSLLIILSALEYSWWCMQNRVVVDESRLLRAWTGRSGRCSSVRDVAGPWDGYQAPPTIRNPADRPVPSVSELSFANMKVAPWHRGHRVRFLNLTSGTLRCALGVRDRHFDATPGWWQMDLQARTSPLLGCTLFRVAVPAG